MPISLEILIITIVLILILIILLVVFDTLKRVKGQFNKGWKALFLAFSLYFILEFMEHVLKVPKNEIVGEFLEVAFLLIVLITVVIIDKKVRELPDGHKKKEYRRTRH